MTKIQVDAKKVIAENQARSEKQVMKQIQKSKDATEAKHREDMRSLVINLAREL